MLLSVNFIETSKDAIKQVFEIYCLYVFFFLYVGD